MICGPPLATPTSPATATTTATTDTLKIVELRTCPASFNRPPARPLQQQTSPTSYDFAPSSPPSAYGTAHPRMRSERHFSASTPPPSTHSSNSNSSSGH
ncbi:hypothetical protein B0H13DRAFT_2385614 [Mycena leptocephala]|nr:hypothetical protein B0H13DRAFT_2385614 [Mycena leptocephala]